MKVSVIVPTLNNVTLGDTLRAIENQTHPPDEVIVVGRDELGITKAFPQVRFVDTERPMCAAAVRNIGMKTARGDIFLFTDADCLPAPDWVTTHIAQQQAGHLVVGGGISVEHTNYWAQADNVSMFHEFATSHPSGSRLLLPTLNLSVRRVIWEAVGGLDESFPGAAGEDSDWTIRMRLAGYNLWFDPTAVVRHTPARTTWKDVVRHWQQSGYNNIRVRIRYAAEFNTPAIVQNPYSLRFLSPLIAAHITAGIYTHPPLWRYWTSLPVVFMTKLIYCWSAARALESGFAFE